MRPEDTAIEAMLVADPARETYTHAATPEVLLRRLFNGQLQAVRSLRIALGVAQRAIPLVRWLADVGALWVPPGHDAYALRDVGQAAAVMRANGLEPEAARLEREWTLHLLSKA